MFSLGTHFFSNFGLVLFLVFFAFDTAPMFHPKPRLLVNVRVYIIFIVGQFDLVPFGVIKRLGHGCYGAFGRGRGAGSMIATANKD